METTKRLAITDRLYVFGLIWFGQIVSLIGSGLTSFALGVWVYLRTGSATQLALIPFFGSLPGLVLSPVAGALVDRWDRRWAMILSDAGAGLSTLALWLMLGEGRLEIWHIYLATTVNSACSAFQWPAYQSVAALLVPKKQLGRASGMIQIGPATAQVIAPLLAGLLVMSIGLKGVLLVDLITFGFALLTLSIVHVPKPKSTSASREAQGSLLQESGSGWAYIKARPGLMGLLFFFSAINLTLGMVLVLIIPLVLSFTDASTLGIILSISGLGMLLGGLALSVWGGPKRRINGVLGFATVCGAVLLLGGLQPSAPLIAAAAFVFMFSVQLSSGCVQPIWQSKVPADIQGRVFATRRMIGLSSVPLSRLLAGPLADHVFEPWLAVDGSLAGSVGRIIGTGPGRGIGLLFIILGALTMLITVVAYSYPRLRQVEEELPDAIEDAEEQADAEKAGRFKRWPIYVGLALVGLVVLGVVGGRWFIHRSWTKVSGTVSLPGLQAPVEIVRDELGVPHIYAQNEHDLFFAQGYVHAQDRLWQMEWNRHVADGTISQVAGRASLETDLYLRALGLRRTAEQSWDLIDRETQTILQAYADGVNAYVEANRNRLPLEFTLLGVDPEPWTPIDTLAWGNVMSLQLSGNLRFEILRMQMIAELGEPITRQLFPAFAEDMPLVLPDQVGQYEGFRQVHFDVLDTLDEWLGDPSLGWGSNNWVVHGSRTQSGKPILANDTHLGMQMPSIWYENGLHGGRFDSVGFTFPGSPLIIIGHNAHIAWGTTNLGPDVQDLYLEKLDDPANPTQYQFMGEWYELETIQETIEIKGGEPETLEIYVTRHGPLLNNVLTTLSDSEPMALSWTLYEGSRLMQSVVRVNLASNWDEFRDALRSWDLPSQNFVYADVEGNIGYQAPGKVPIRGPDHQGTLPVPGWTGEYEWLGYIPFDELPSALNPPMGFVATANNKVTTEAYEYSLTYDWFPGYRAKRINDLLAASDQHTLEDMQAIQAETYSLPAEALRPYMLAVEPEDDLQAEAIARLRDWDLYLETDRVGASIYQTWYLFSLRNTVGDELGETQEQKYLQGNYQRHGTQHVPLMIGLMADPGNPWFDDVHTPQVETRDDILSQSLEEALDWLSQEYGKEPEDWAWGRLHTITFNHASLGQHPLLGRFFNSKTIPARGDPFTVNAAGFYWSQPFQMVHGTSQRMVLDTGDWDQSVAIHTTGQSGQAFHPHREDMISMWQRMEYASMPFTREGVEAIAQDVLTLQPSE